MNNWTNYFEKTVKHFQDWGFECEVEADNCFFLKCGSQVPEDDIVDVTLKDCQVLGGHWASYGFTFERCFLKEATVYGAGDEPDISCQDILGVDMTFEQLNFNNWTTGMLKNCTFRDCYFIDVPCFHFHNCKFIRCKVNGKSIREGKSLGNNIFTTTSGNILEENPFAVD